MTRNAIHARVLAYIRTKQANQCMCSVNSNSVNIGRKIITYIFDLKTILESFSRKRLLLLINFSSMRHVDLRNDFTILKKY